MKNLIDFKQFVTESKKNVTKEVINEGLSGKIAKFIQPKEYKKILEYVKDVITSEDEENEYTMEGLTKANVLEILTPVIMKKLKKIFTGKTEPFKEDSKLIKSLSEVLFDDIKK